MTFLPTQTTMTNSPAPAAPSFFQQIRWPIVVVALLLGHIVLMMVGLVAALAIPDAFVPPGGYETAIAWDDRQAERQASIALGWTLHANPSPTTELNGDRTVKFTLADRNGQPVDGANLVVRLFHHARSGDQFERSLEQSAAGTYEALLPMRREGLWRLQAAATRGDDRFVVETDFWVGAKEINLGQGVSR